MPDPMSPTKRVTGRELDAWNEQWRASPLYQEAVRSVGADPSRPLHLSGDQREGIKRFLAARGVQVPKGLQIDPAANWNTDHGLSTAWSNPYFRYPLIAAGALGTAGALGAFGGAGAAGGGAGAVGGGGAASVGGTIPYVHGGLSMGMPAPAGMASTPGLLSRFGNAITGGGNGGANQWLQAALAGLSGVPALIAANKSKPSASELARRQPSTDELAMLQPSADELAMQQQVKDMLAHQQRRTQYQDPLYQAVSQLAMSRLPTGVQKPMGDL